MALATAGFAVVLSMHLLLVKQVGGGTPIRPVLLAGASSAMLLLATLGLRYLLDGNSFGSTIGIIALVGIAYLGLQYLFLRQHLKEKR
jgi:hypothetical protein